METSIRQATVQDAADIVRLIGEHASADDETSPLTSAFVKQYLASPVSEILVAEIDQQIVGLLSWSLRPDLFHGANSCFVEELVVSKQVQGQGIGRALMTELFGKLCDRNCAEASLAVMPDNTRAIALYRSLGLCEEALMLEMHMTPGMPSTIGNRLSHP